MLKVRFAAAFVLALGVVHAQDTQVVTLPAPPGGMAPKPTVHAVTEDAPASPTPTASTGASRTRGLLWKATSGTTTVYLAGSLHFGSPDMYPLPPEMESAFRASSVLVVEVDVSAMSPTRAMSLMATSGTYPPGDSLWNHVSERTRSALPAFAAQYGLSADMLARLRPWAVDFMLSSQMMQQAGMRPDLGIDMHFLGLAKGSKRTEALETVDEQISALANIPDRENAHALEEAVTKPERAAQVLRNLRAAWISGDTAALDALMAEEFKDAPESRRRLLDDRNVRMTAGVEGYLKGGETVFVVVGGAHLIGKGGVVSRLAAKGYTVKRVASAN
ncbi:MAG TPA: TraB/GumN family protein [Bryobacteraceae bacterium]|nr:TraB/GumN family protein [Bryobacteraceae bacterium]